MKRKLLIALGLSYILLILMILVIGLNLQRNDQPVITETSSASATPGETVQQVSKTTTDDISTQTWIVTSSIETETLLSPGVEPSATHTITAVSEEPTQSGGTATPSAPTSTQSGYPVSGEGTATTITTQPPYPVEDQATATLSSTLTATITSTTTTQTGWVGNWTVFWEQDDGSLLSGLMAVNLDGSEITASVSIGEDQYNFTGVLNESQLTVVGSWSGSDEAGNFYWRSSMLGQFAGNLDRQVGFCGARSEEDLLESCFTVPAGR